MEIRDVESVSGPRLYGCLPASASGQSNHAVGWQFALGLLAAVTFLVCVSSTAARPVAVSGHATRVARSRPRPVEAVLPPKAVLVALQQTQHARYLVLSEVSQNGPVKYELDNIHGTAATFTDSKVSLIEIGGQAYTPGRWEHCYASAKRPGAWMPNAAGTLLPSGIAALHYTVNGRTIGWAVRAGKGYRPHGTVSLNAAGRIVSAVIHSGPGSPLTARIAYPARAPRIVAPKQLCASKASSGKDR